MEEVYRKLDELSLLYDKEERDKKTKELELEYMKEKRISLGLSQGISQWISQGIEEGISSRNIEIAQNMIKKNIDMKTISEVTGLSIEKIKKLKRVEL